MQVVVVVQVMGIFEILQFDWYFTILRRKRHGIRNSPSFYQTLYQANWKGWGLGTRLFSH